MSSPAQGPHNIPHSISSAAALPCLFSPATQLRFLLCTCSGGPCTSWTVGWCLGWQEHGRTSPIGLPAVGWGACVPLWALAEASAGLLMLLRRWCRLLHAVHAGPAGFGRTKEGTACDSALGTSSPVQQSDPIRIRWTCAWPANQLAN